MIDADRQRNEVREALTALRKAAPAPSSVVLLQPGGVFVRSPAAGATAALEARGRELERRVEALREEQKRLIRLLEERGGVASGSAGWGEGLTGAALRLRG
jgi:chaperonin cofactor prefoldin